MTTITGQIKKLSGQLHTPIKYDLSVGSEILSLNSLLGKTLSLQFLQAIYCIQCNRKTQKSFHQGHCYPCYRQLMDCNLCVIHPEKCNYPKQNCPDTWAHVHCKQEHIVYLANSSGLKVGITRLNNIPTRWIDQGASQAIPIFKVSNRYQSGLVEVFFKQFVADKTNWRKMLQSDPEPLDMIIIKEGLLNKAEPGLKSLDEQTQLEKLSDPCLTLTYPILETPKKFNTLSFDKNLQLEGQLLGIKGQYLILDTGVLNIRKYAGYQIAITF